MGAAIRPLERIVVTTRRVDLAAGYPPTPTEIGCNGMRCEERIHATCSGWTSSGVTPSGDLDIG